MTITYNWGLWSKWLKLDGINLSDIPSCSGAYVIATRKPIPRVVEIDSDGFLDIGESDHLRDRISSFIRCAKNPTSYGHMAGVRFAFLGFSSSFPFTSLWVRWISSKDKHEAYSIEGELLKQYVQIHKELPPLNYKYNWSKHE